MTYKLIQDDFYESLPCLQECIKDHETIHLDDCLGRGGWEICQGFQGDVYVSSGNEFLNDSECRTYKEELDCLNRNLEKDECDIAKPAMKSKKRGDRL